jgi:hypothetical protein
MAGTPVVGTAPVTFVTESAKGSPGVQYQCPLTALTINAKGEVDRSAWSAPTALKKEDLANLDTLLADLLARGVIGPAPP